MDDHWLERRLKEIGKKKKDLADAIFNGRNATITRVINGQRAIRADEVGELSQFLQLPESDVLQHIGKKSPELGIPLSVVSVPVVGVVQAGLWQEPLLETEEYIPIPETSSLSRSAFGLRVKGDSMDQFYEEGRILICLSTWDYPKDIVSGDHIICHRVGSAEEVEATVKEVRRDQSGRIWLWPRSNNPDHQDPWLCPEPDYESAQAGSAEIYIAAVVIGDYRVRI